MLVSKQDCEVLQDLGKQVAEHKKPVKADKHDKEAL